MSPGEPKRILSRSRLLWVSAWLWAAVILGLYELALPLPLGRVLTTAMAHHQNRRDGTTSLLSVFGHVEFGNGIGIFLFLAHWGALLIAGRVARQFLWSRPRDPSTRVLAAMGLGWFCGGVAMFGLGMTGLIFPEILAAFPFALLIGKTRRYLIRDLRIAASSLSPPNADVMQRWSYFGLVLGWAITSVLLLLPETHPDALIYHLPIPARMVQLHKYAPPVWNCLHHLPVQAELLRVWPLAFGSEVGARLISMEALVVCTLAIGVAVARMSGVTAGWIAAALWATTSIGTNLAVALKPDLFVAALLVTSMLASEHPGGSVVSGILLATAMAFKPTALFIIPVVSVLVIRESGWRCAALLAVAGICAGAVWPIRGWLEMGDPIFPFGSGSLGEAAKGIALLGNVRTAPGVAGDYHSLVGALAAPWTLTFRDSIPPFLLATIPLSALVLRKHSQWRWWLLGGCGWIFWLVWMKIPVYAAPVLACLHVAVTAAVFENAHLRRRFAGLLVACVLVSQGARLVTTAIIERPWPVLCGLQTRSEYREEGLTTYAEMVEIMRHVPSSRNAVYVGEWRGWPASQVMAIPSSFDLLPFQDLVRRSFTAKELARRWRQLGARYIVHNHPGAMFLRGMLGVHTWTQRDLSVWDAFWREHAKLEWSSNWYDTSQGFYELYEVHPLSTVHENLPPTLPGVEGVFAAIEEMRYAGASEEARMATDALNAAAGRVPQVIGFLGAIKAESNVREAESYLKKASLAGFKDCPTWELLARLASLHGRETEADYWRNKAAEFARPANSKPAHFH